MTPAELIKWREDKGLTQSAAAKKIGMTARQWQKLEAGDHPIRRIHSLALLALSTPALRNAIEKMENDNA
mgnify:CR=1 FL=1